MGYILREYGSLMRIRMPDGIREIEGSWHFCPPGAIGIPFMHPYMPTEFKRGPKTRGPVLGEVPSSRRKALPQDVSRYLGKCFIGDEDDWNGRSEYPADWKPDVDVDGVPVACCALPRFIQPFFFGGAGEEGSGRLGAIKWRGAGQLVSFASLPFFFGGAGIGLGVGSGAFFFGGGGSLYLAGSGAFTFGGGGLLVNVGSGTFLFAGEGEEEEEGSGDFDFGGGGLLVNVGSGTFLFAGEGEEEEEGSGDFDFGGGGLVLAGGSVIGSGSFAFGGSGLLIELASGSFSFGGGGSLYLAGSGAFTFGGGGLLLSFGSGTFLFSGAGTQTGLSMAFASDKFDFDRQEVGNAGSSTVEFVTTLANNGTGTVDNSVVGMFWSCQLKTGTFSSSGAAGVLMNYNGSTGIFPLQSNTSNACEIRLKIPTLSTSGERFTVQVGFLNVVTGTPAEGVYFEYIDNVNSGAWVLKTKKTSGGAGNSSANAASGPVAGTVYLMKVVVTGTSAEFFIDGVSVGTVATNVPTASLSIGVCIVKSVGTGSRECDVDSVTPTVTF